MRNRWMWATLAVAGLFVTGAKLLAADAKTPPPWAVLVAPENSFGFSLLHADKVVLRGSVGGWGPNWGWRPGPESKTTADGPELHLTSPFSTGPADQTINIDLTAKEGASPNSVEYTYKLTSQRDVALTMLKVGLAVPEGQAGQVTFAGADGETTLDLPPRLHPELTKVAKATFKLKGATGDISVVFEPPILVGLENGEIRLQLAHQTFKAGTESTKMTWSFPETSRLFASKQAVEQFVKPVAGPDWFVWQPKNTLAASPISYDTWLDAPAGKHGGVRMVKDAFQFTDGTPVKFWGVNLSYGNSAPEKAVADATAARFAKYGVNAVRMHKFTGAGWEGIGDANDATKMDEKGLARLDYFSAQLAKRGVYYGWSHTYHFRVLPGNRGQVLAYDELAAHDNGDTYALINYADDVQALLTERVVNLLKHKNVVTGKTYAEDPALAYIELQNEDDIFFYTTSAVYAKYPTYAKHLRERFGQWLKAKYKTDAALRKAWAGTIKPNEALASSEIEIQPNPWAFGSDNLPNQKDGARQRLLDNAEFFFDIQNDFYQKMSKAIRDTGYKGPICGSPWQAPSGLPQYYNLKADYLAGWIDRHNYFDGKINDSMLSEPGSGYLSTGLQQVVDRPFGISEWIHVYPALYSAEGPVLMAAYGMGLQGWDSSYEFQSTATGRFAAIAGRKPFGVWEADVPNQIGQFPLLARMIARGDVKESPVISTRRISTEEFQSGKLNFSDKVEQRGDVKNFGGSVAPAALAAGRCVVEFGKDSKPSTFPDLAKFTKGTVITSATGQLQWDTANKGLVTIDTPGTKAVVGFAEGKKCELGDVAITSETPYAVILVTASGKSETLATAKTALVSAVARNCNSKSTFFAAEQQLLENGDAPILIEPVRATIAFPRAVSEVRVLDQDGTPTTRKLTPTGNAIQFDTAKDRTIYYEVVFK